MVREKACAAVKLYLHKAISEHVWGVDQQFASAVFFSTGVVRVGSSRDRSLQTDTVCPYEEVIPSLTLFI